MDLERRFRLRPGRPVDLSALDPGFIGDATRESAAEGTARNARRLGDLQYLLHAERRRSLLVCIQGLDASGKDGTIRNVVRSMGPEGVHAHAFKVPSAEEASHDFLRRIHLRTPAHGDVTVFNRSHYEDVLVPRVHGTLPEKVWRARYDTINAFEASLDAAGTRVLKIFLLMSPEEQLRRFEQRLDDPMRRWKITESDYTDRERWRDYVEAYEEALARTGTRDAPWYVVPSDHKWFRDLAVSSILVAALESMGLAVPQPSVDLARIRARYHAAVKAAASGRGPGRKRR